MGKTYYFSHDYNAIQDLKIKKLIRFHGMAGYGLFWAIIEELYNNTNVLKLDYERIAYELRIDEKVVKSVINDFELFKISGEYFGSLSVQRRLDEMAEKSSKARTSVKKRWDDFHANVNNNNTNVSKLDTNVNKIDTIKENKIKESKEDEEGPEHFNPIDDQSHDIDNNAFLQISECRRIYDEQNSAAKDILIKNTRLSKERFAEFQTKFDEFLIGSGVYSKVFRDYPKHFSNWLHKQDLTPPKPESKTPKTVTAAEYAQTFKA